MRHTEAGGLRFLNENADLDVDAPQILVWMLLESGVDPSETETQLDVHPSLQQLVHLRARFHLQKAVFLLNQTGSCNRW